MIIEIIITFFINCFIIIFKNASMLFKVNFDVKRKTEIGTIYKK